VLDKNPTYWKDAPARLDRIEFRASLPAAAIAAGLKSGEYDVARDLLPQDREAILRDPRFRSGLVETPKKNTYFAVFSRSGAAAENPTLRRALSDAARARDFVWGTLGRFAASGDRDHPARILGHDPGRRLPHASREKAAELVRSAGLPLPVRLRASVHPILRDQYGALTTSLLSSWAELGVEVTVGTRTCRVPGLLERAGGVSTSFSAAGSRTTKIRTTSRSTLFHSGNGRLRRYFLVSGVGRDPGRGRRESRPGARESLYRKFENSLLDSAF
jgi:hypothetical protein